jgi:hypothetical protein
MATSRAKRDAGESAGAAVQPAPPGGAGEPQPAWEEIAGGRYRPRRIRGSFRGGELG